MGIELELLVFCSGKFLLFQCFQSYFILSLLCDSVYPVLGGGPWSTWIWASCRLISGFWMGLCAFFYMHTCSKSSSIFHCMVLASLPLMPHFISIIYWCLWTVYSMASLILKKEKKTHPIINGSIIWGQILSVFTTFIVLVCVRYILYITYISTVLEN